MTDDEARAQSAEACDAFTRIHDRCGEPASVAITSLGPDGNPLPFDRLFEHWELFGRFLLTTADVNDPEQLRRARYLTSVLAPLRVQSALTSLGASPPPADAASSSSCSRA